MIQNFFLLAVESKGFGLNPDILQTNLINIVIILVVMVYFGRGIVGKILRQRLSAIETAIKDAESRKANALEQLSVQQQKLAQTQAECDRLLSKANQDAQVAKAAILSTVAEDIARLKAAAQREISTEQERAIAQVREQVVAKSLAQVNEYFNRGLSDHVQTQLVDRSLDLLNANRS
jgi:F-type H+-transporting ATPase subunit b